MKKYAYDGPVMIFDRCVASHWKAETMAVSAAKAKSNMTFQFKKMNNMLPSCKVTLTGGVKEIDQ